ncbi:MAG: hypothetical protein AABX63_04465 [Nanoarchaeota archaeon]
MRKKAAGILVLAMLFITAMSFAVVAANPLETYFQGKLLPFAQSTATIMAILYLITGGLKFLKADDPAEKDKGIKTVVGVAIAIAVIWLAPALVEFLKPG